MIVERIGKYIEWERNCFSEMCEYLKGWLIDSVVCNGCFFSCCHSYGRLIIDTYNQTVVSAAIAFILDFCQ